MVLAEQNCAAVVDGPSNATSDPQLFAQPGLDGRNEHVARTRKCRPVTREDAFELQQWLFVEDDVVEVNRVDAAGFQAILDRTLWEAGVVLLAAEALFFGRRDDQSVAQ